MYYTIFTAKVDFTKALKGGKTLETGLKGSWVESDNNLDLSRAENEGPFEQDPNSNRFIYNEQVLAAYVSLKGSFSKKLSYQGGLRGEYSDIVGNSVTLNQVNKQDYLNFFPSLFVQHKVSDNYQIVYNANRRITRPNYRLLNPFVYYIDPLTSETGNPNLKPQYSTNFEMNHVVKGAYQFTVGYSVTEDAFMQVFIQDQEERTTTTFTDNFEQTRNANFRAIVPVEIKKMVDHFQYASGQLQPIPNADWRGFSGCGSGFLPVQNTAKLFLAERVQSRSDGNVPGAANMGSGGNRRIWMGGCRYHQVCDER